MAGRAIPSTSLSLKRGQDLTPARTGSRLPLVAGSLGPGFGRAFLSCPITAQPPHQCLGALMTPLPQFGYSSGRTCCRRTAALVHSTPTSTSNIRRPLAAAACALLPTKHALASPCVHSSTYGRVTTAGSTASELAWRAPAAQIPHERPFQDLSPHPLPVPN